MNRLLNFIKSHIKPIIALLLVVVTLAVAIHSCGHVDSETLESNLIEESNQDEDVASNVADDVKTDSLEEDSAENTLVIEIESGSISDIYSMVCSAVEFKLSEAGFTCEPGIAMTVDNDDYESIGTYYYKDDLDLFTTNDIKSVGFVEVAKDDREFFDPSKEESMIVVDPLSSDDQTDLICTYNYNDIGSSHFVYKGKYVTYYQQTPMRVVYSVQDNNPENYDLSIGSLYDYDKGLFLYDESIFDEYVDHSAVELFSDEDYEELEKSLKEISRNQLINGYTVNQYDVVYISPEQIQAYLDGNEDETFFGYSIDDLTETMGIGTALEYTSDGLKQADLGEEDLKNYNWKSFLTKVGIGCGIIIVGAVLTPITGGASFACALVTIAKITVTASLCAAIGTMAIDTAKGMMDGKSFTDAINGSTFAGLDSFANTFIITAAIASIGVTTGLIKPTACFVAGTEIAALDSNGHPVHKPIEDIQIGDRVLSFSETNNTLSYERVTETYVRTSDELVCIRTNNGIIRSTPEHPFYNPTSKRWMSAIDLEAGEKVLTSAGAHINIESINTFSPTNEIDVYNLTVSNNHTYYVGCDEILVHNTCDRITKLRNKGVRNAWKEEVKAVKNGTSRYNWTPEQIKELLTTGKVAGYDGHHIIPVSQLKNTAKEFLISSADDIALIPHETHVLVHAGNNAAGNMEVLVKCVPWVEKQLVVLLAM